MLTTIASLFNRKATHLLFQTSRTIITAFDSNELLEDTHLTQYQFCIYNCSIVDLFAHIYNATKKHIIICAPERIKEKLLLTPTNKELLTKRELTRWRRKNYYCAKFYVAGQYESVEESKHLFADDINQFIYKQFGISCSWETMLTECYAVVFANDAPQGAEELLLPELKIVNLPLTLTFGNTTDGLVNFLNDAEDNALLFPMIDETNYSGRMRFFFYEASNSFICQDENNQRRQLKIINSTLSN